MSADNLVRIKRKENGKYQVRYEAASSLMHALVDEEPTEDELLYRIVADDVETHEEAFSLARKFVNEYEEDGGIIEYGIVDENWRK